MVSLPYGRFEKSNLIQTDRLQLNSVILPSLYIEPDDNISLASGLVSERYDIQTRAQLDCLERLIIDRYTDRGARLCGERTQRKCEVGEVGNMEFETRASPVSRIRKTISKLIKTNRDA